VHVFTKNNSFQQILLQAGNFQQNSAKREQLKKPLSGWPRLLKKKKIF